MPLWHGENQAHEFLNPFEIGRRGGIQLVGAPDHVGVDKVQQNLALFLSKGLLEKEPVKVVYDGHAAAKATA